MAAFALCRPRNNKVPESQAGTTQSVLFSPTGGMGRAMQWCPQVTLSGPAQDHVSMLMPVMQM